MKHPFFGQALSAGMHSMAACVATGRPIQPDIFEEEREFDFIIARYAKNYPHGSMLGFGAREREIIAGYWRDIHTLATTADRCWFKKTIEGHKFDVIMETGGVYTVVDVISYSNLAKTVRQDTHARSMLKASCRALQATCPDTVEAAFYYFRNDLSQRYEPILKPLTL